MKKLRIAILGNSHKEHPSPKDAIFGPGVTATQLANGLVERGHAVDLYAPKGSKSKAKIIDFDLRSVYSLYDRTHGLDSAYYTRQFVQADLLNLSEAITHLNKGKYDLIHTHDIRNSATLAPLAKKPLLHTLHTAMTDDMLSVHQKYALKKYRQHNRCIAISSRQERGLNKKYFSVAARIPHGVDLAHFAYSPTPEEYALFAGRITEEKGAHIAVEACRKARHPLILAGNIPSDDNSKRYWEKYIKPHLSKQIRHVGHVAPKHMAGYYQKARVLLFTSQVEESFGLAAVEALSCGTPIIATKTGITEDAVINGTTGYLISGAGAASNALKQINGISRTACRKHAEDTFSLERMVEAHEALYYKLYR